MAIVLESRSPRVRLEAHGSRSRPIRWGHPWEFLTAAYWVECARIARAEGWFDSDRPHRLGSSFTEEVVACILGGFGVKYESGIAAFERLRDTGLIAEGISQRQEIERQLRIPFLVRGRTTHYRFPAQRARRLSEALELLPSIDLDRSPREVRQDLLTLPGVGLKTASWIVRNHFGSNEVAIVDIHILRAGIHADVFKADWRPDRDYLVLEEAFLEWAQIGEVPTGELDSTIWSSQAAASRNTSSGHGALETSRGN